MKLRSVFKALAIVAISLLLFGITAFTQQGMMGAVFGSLYPKLDDSSSKFKAISLTAEASPLKYASVDHCPYYPPEASHIPSILSESTLLQYQDAEKRFQKSKPIILVIVNSNHVHFLANWLCVSARHINTQNLLVAVPPEESDFVDVLRSKGINAIQTNYRKECLDRNMKHMDQFHRALLIRNLMIMLLTDRGHDVAVFDPDAFILQDPMDMYQKIVQEAHAHVIGQRGSMPVRFTKLWGFTLCAGAMFYHSSIPLNDLWQAISDQHFQAGSQTASDDQKLLNSALHKLGIQWQNTVSQQMKLFDSHIGTAGNLTVVAVAANYSARASPSEFDALDHRKVRILHAKLGKFGKGQAIQTFQDSLWRLSAKFKFHKTTTDISEKVMDLNTWLKQICLQ